MIAPVVMHPYLITRHTPALQQNTQYTLTLWIWNLSRFSTKSWIVTLFVFLANASQLILLRQSELGLPSHRIQWQKAAAFPILFPMRPLHFCCSQCPKQITSCRFCERSWDYLCGHITLWQPITSSGNVTKMPTQRTWQLGVTQGVLLY